MNSRTARFLQRADYLTEVAESLGISLAAAKSRTHRARLFLRKRLAELGSSFGPAIAG